METMYSVQDSNSQDDDLQISIIRSAQQLRHAHFEKKNCQCCSPGGDDVPCTRPRVTRSLLI